MSAVISVIILVEINFQMEITTHQCLFIFKIQWIDTTCENICSAMFKLYLICKLILLYKKGFLNYVCVTVILTTLFITHPVLFLKNDNVLQINTDKLI